MSSGLFNRPYENRSFAAGQLPGTECHAVTQELAAFKVAISFEIIYENHILELRGEELNVKRSSQL